METCMHTRTVHHPQLRVLSEFPFNNSNELRTVGFVRTTATHTTQATMGSSESTLSSTSSSSSSSSKPGDEITTLSERVEGVDPLLPRLKSLKIATPILTSLPKESTLTDILVRKQPSSSSAPGTLNPKVLLELFSMYHDWQEAKAKKFSQRQEEIENKIEFADALAAKLFQRFNYSVSAMRTSTQHLSEVQPLQVEVGELKGRLTEVISICDALCKRIAEKGPESLRTSVKPFSAAAAVILFSRHSSSSLQRVSTRNSSSTTTI